MSTIRVHRVIVKSPMVPTGNIEVLSYSAVNEGLYLLSDENLFHLSAEELERIYELETRAPDVESVEVEATLLHSGNIEAFDLPRKSQRVGWLEDDRLHIMTVRDDRVEQTVDPSAEKDSIVQFALYPSGESVLYLYERDDESEELLLYDWVIHDLSTGESRNVFSESSIQPAEFVGWVDPQTPAFVDFSNNRLFYQELPENQSTLIMEKSSDIYAARLDRSEKKTRFVVTLETADDGVEVFSASSLSELKSEAVAPCLTDAHAIAMSSDGTWSLVSREKRNEYVFSRFHLGHLQEEPIVSISDEQNTGSGITWLSDVNRIVVAQYGALLFCTFDALKFE